MHRDVRHLQHVGGAERIEGVIHAVLSETDIDARLKQLLYAGNAPADRLLVQAPLQHEVCHGIRDHMDAGAFDLLNDIGRVMVVISG